LEKLGLGLGIIEKKCVGAGGGIQRRNSKKCVGEFKEGKRNNTNSLVFGRGYSVIHIN
jgi:hypothetical protein